MKAFVVPCIGALDLVEIAPPEPGLYDALVRIEACGICNSTDAKFIEGKMGWFLHLRSINRLGGVRTTADRSV